MSRKIERGVLVSKSKLHPNPWNPNHMSNRQKAAITESIEAFGQVNELLVRPHPELPNEYQIIDGEHRYNVMPDNVYCNVIYDLSEAEAKKLTIVMNETKGEADKIELATLLSSIAEDMGDDLILALPYEPSELEELLKLAEHDWEQYDEEDDSDEDDTDYGEPDKEGQEIQVTCPSCGHEFIRVLD